MRLFLFLFIIFSCSVFAAGQPAKVVSVIPVKFNGKGLHAPVPYNQQMMQRGWASVPSISVPLSGGSPRYQPVRIAKPNLIRTLSRMGYQAAKMSPAGKLALVAYGAYEANCTSELFTSLCIDGPEQPTTTCQIGAPLPDVGCAVPAYEGTLIEVYIQGFGGWDGTGKGITFTQAFENAKKDMPTPYVFNDGSLTTTYTITGKPTSCPTSGFFTTAYRFESIRNDIGTVSNSGTGNANVYCSKTASQPSCPSNDPNHRDFITLHSLSETSHVCVKPFDTASTPVPVTPEWLDEQYQKNPQPIINSDIGLDDFVDWETGAPYPDLFDNPTFDPVSPSFADAAESIANGTVQHTNPNAPHYVPSEMMPNLLIQINNWHEGNTFTDLYTGQTITPESPPKEETPIDWSKFPGITKAQYEASNNAWGNQAVQGQNIKTEVDKLTQEQQKLSDFIESPLPNFTGQPKLLDFVTLPTGGGCRGFTLSVSLQGQAKSITVDQHCPPYNDWGQPVVSWLLSIYTLLLCFRIFHRTIEVA